MWQKLGKAMIITMVLLGVAIPAGAYEVGDRGEQILLIQHSLRSYGYRITADGVYGAETAKAVQRFQADKGLNINGAVGADTYYRLTGKKIPSSEEGRVQFSQSSRADIGSKLVAAANRYIGVPYVFGGNTPSGFDCSGFTRYVFRREGIQLPRLADEQYMLGARISRNDLLPGDLVFFTTYEPGASHTGIYVGGGRFISATSSGGVRVDSLSNSYWGPWYLGAKRVR